MDARPGSRGTKSTPRAAIVSWIRSIRRGYFRGLVLPDRNGGLSELQERDGPGRDALGTTDEADPLAPLRRDRDVHAVAHGLAHRRERLHEVAAHRLEVRRELRRLR